MHSYVGGSTGVNCIAMMLSTAGEGDENLTRGHGQSIPETTAGEGDAG